MYRFLMPKPDGSIIDIMIGANDLAGAFEEFSRLWWRQDMTRSIAVFQNAALVARIVPVLQLQTLELEPHLQEIRP